MARPVSESPSLQDFGPVYLERSNAPRLLTLDEPLPPDADLFLGAVLDRFEQEGGLPRLLFVATGGEARDAGLVALGIARVAAGRGIRVLLADLGVDSPVLAKPFPYQPEEGFVDMVLWGSSFPAVVRKTRDERIGIVCVGSPPPDPDRLLADPACDAVLGTFRGEGELVIAVGRLRGESGVPSPILRKADRTLVVRVAGEEFPSLDRVVPPDRLSLVTLGEELAETSPSRAGRRAPEPPKKEAAGRGERKRLPLFRVGVLIGLLSIASGIFLSTLYLRHREESARGRIELARSEPEPARVVPVTPPSGPASEAETRIVEEEGPPAPENASPPVLAIGGAPVQEGPEQPASTPPPEERRTASAALPRPAEKQPAPPPIGVIYGVHVESFPTRGDAEKGAARFRESGEKVTIVEKEIPEKGTWYRIVLGRFTTQREASAHAEEIKETFGLSYALVVRLSP